VKKAFGAERTLVVGGNSMGENFYPAATNPGWSHLWVNENIYDTLYFSRDLKTYTPRLALSYTVSPDGLVYTFKLRQGVKFHDGTPFNAEAVEFHFMRMIDKNHPYYEPEAVTSSDVIPGVVKVKATDEYDVQFIRDSPLTGQVILLSGAYAGIISPASVKKYGKDYGAHPVGCGPFVFEKSEKGNYAEIRAFPDYWGGRPKLDRVVIRVITDDQTMTASLLSGDIDMTQFVDYKELNSFRKNPKLQVVTVPAASVGYVGIMSRKPQVKDVRVRQAICHAIDPQKIIDTIFYGEADAGGGQVPLALPGYAPQFKNYYKYDPQRARDLLKEAGFPNGFECDLWTQSSTFWPRAAELYQSMFAAVGIKVDIQQLDTGKFFAAMTEGKHTLFIADSTWTVGDEDEEFYSLYGCDVPRSLGRWGYCDKNFDLARQKESAILDPKKRRDAVWDLQKRLLDYVPQAWPYYNRFATVMSKRVQGYQAMGIRTLYLDKTSVSSA
jgi:peptide/nickel transport system substrate-binding protein